MKMNYKFKWLGGLVLPFIWSHSASAALLEEVVVTAQKREQNLQDVGIAITAFTGDQADALGWESGEDVAAQTPGLIATSFNGDSSTTFYVVRGLGQADFGDQHEAPTVVYMDGAYIPNTGAAAVQLFDTERIETLKGPQGTLFGRNATGGLIHVLSRKPTEELEAYLDIEVSEYNTFRIESAVSGSVTDNVQGRLSVMKHEADGFLDNSAGHDLREEDNLGVRLQLQTEFTDRLYGHLVMMYNQVDDISGGAYTPVLLAGDQADWSGFTPNSDPHKASSSPNGGLDKENYGVTATFTYDINEDWVFTSITNWQKNNKRYDEDSDSSPARQAEYFSDMDADVFGQEFRVNGKMDRSNWTAGVYYLNIDGDYRAHFRFPDLIGFANTSVLGDNFFSMETESWAIFGQFDYALTDSLTLTTGLRYTYDEKDIDLTSVCDAGPNPVTGVALPVITGFGPGWDGLNGCEAFGITGGLFGPQGSQTVVDAGRTVLDRRDEDLTAKLQLDWRLSDQVLLYAGYNRGMKAGGYSPSSDTAIFVEDLEFDKEVLHAYEVGIKSDFLDGRLRVNAAAFYYDYRDYQAFVFAGLSNVVINQDANVVGGEIEIITNPMDGLDVMLGVSILDATVEDLPGGVGDQDMLLAPDLTANMLIRKEWQLGNGNALAVQVDGVYVDDQTSSSVNTLGAAVDSYDVWNARASYISENWEASIFVRNLADEEYWTYAFDMSGYIAGNEAVRGYGPPRWAGVNFKYNW